MSKRWLRERKNDFYYKKAKRMDYRSRASFKLMQIDDRFNVLPQGGAVADLGAAPGGWLQVAQERVGPRGKVVGVDLQHIEPLEGVATFRGDITRPETVDRLKELLGGKADTIISDMSPNISGSYSLDHARSVELCTHALNFARQTLKPGGSLVMKIFEGDMMPGFLNEVRKSFSTLKLHSPKASRASSSEIYIVARGFRPAEKEGASSSSAPADPFDNPY